MRADRRIAHSLAAQYRSQDRGHRGSTASFEPSISIHTKASTSLEGAIIPIRHIDINNINININNNNNNKCIHSYSKRVAGTTQPNTMKRIRNCRRLFMYTAEA